MKGNLIQGLGVTVVSVLLIACGGGYTGELTGVLNRPIWNHVMPYGTVYIPSGTLHIGPSDQDVNRSFVPELNVLTYWV